MAPRTREWSLAEIDRFLEHGEPHARERGASSSTLRIAVTAYTPAGLSEPWLGRLEVLRGEEEESDDDVEVSHEVRSHAHAVTALTAMALRDYPTTCDGRIQVYIRDRAAVDILAAGSLSNKAFNRWLKEVYKAIDRLEREVEFVFGGVREARAARDQEDPAPVDE